MEEELLEQFKDAEFLGGEEFKEYEDKVDLVQANRMIKGKNGEKKELINQQIPSQKKILQKPKKPLSAYFLFIQHYKTKVGSKINLKEMGALWNETSQVEKQIYYKMQEEDKVRYNKEMEEYIAKQGDDEFYMINEEQLDNELDLAFPISRIKGILKADEDNKLLSKDVLLHFEKATELFGSYLAQKCYRKMQEGRRKKLQTSDLCNNFQVKRCKVQQNNDIYNIQKMMQQKTICTQTSCHVIFQFNEIGIIPPETIPEETEQSQAVIASQSSSKSKGRKLIIYDDDIQNKEMEVENVGGEQKDEEIDSPLNSSKKKNINQNISNKSKPAKKEKIVLPPPNNRKIDSFFTKK